MYGTDEERLWSKVDRGGGPQVCWLWRASTDRRGYGVFYASYRKGRVFAHRAAYQLTLGVSLSSDVVLRHTCDTPACVNPAHLMPGTHADNVRDTVERGHMPMGSVHCMSKLTESQAAEILSKYERGWTRPRLAAEYGVARATIGSLVRRITWKHVSAEGSR